MASAELRIIRRRIKSVKSTMKITRAMELIAASQIAKAQDRVSKSIPYVQQLRNVIRNVAAASGSSDHILLADDRAGDVGVMVITSDRGLAGAYNTNVIRAAERYIERLDERPRLYVVGKKAQGYFRYRGYEIQRAFLGMTDRPVYGDARQIANIVLDDYARENVRSLLVYYTEFKSALTQDVAQFTLMPVEPPASDETAETATTAAAYSYEPSPEVILGRLLPRYVEASVFGALLNASASEHAARRRAMKAATENAEDLTKILTRTANQARQAEITTEISEIVGGAEALSGR
ncbi:MAG: F0F1 ATP synthase subunit gamma [Acidimicrobiia bacterium]|nr:F0F1 ATP synthase subunit gamma [Acidimicrobiia bacterium]NND12500.1 F0F1 ATP synthase subunit gamma [Acidimicrobiia bacterium]